MIGPLCVGERPRRHQDASRQQLHPSVATRIVKVERGVLVVEHQLKLDVVCGVLEAIDPIRVSQDLGKLHLVRGTVTGPLQDRYSTIT